jgi:hypothetical protein
MKSHTALLLLFFNRILTAANDQRALESLRGLTNIGFLGELYGDPETPEKYKKLAALLLLTIAKCTRNPSRKKDAVDALFALRIMREDDACVLSKYIYNDSWWRYEYITAIHTICQQLYQTNDDFDVYWERHNIEQLVQLVENAEDLSSYCSETMEEAIWRFRRTLFMSSFMQLYNSRLTVESLNKLLNEFNEITVDAYNAMNPSYVGCQDDKKYIDDCFLQEHQLRASHIVSVLQEKSCVANESEKKVVSEMLVRVNELNAMLCPN